MLRKLAVTCAFLIAAVGGGMAALASTGNTPSTPSGWIEVTCPNHLTFKAITKQLGDMKCGLPHPPPTTG